MWSLIKVDRVDRGLKVKRRRRRRKCHQCGRTTNNEQGKIELLSQLMLEGWDEQNDMLLDESKNRKKRNKKQYCQQNKRKCVYFAIIFLWWKLGRKGREILGKSKKMIQNNNLLVTLVKSNFSDSLSFHYTSISRVTTTWDDSYSSRKI